MFRVQNICIAGLVVVVQLCGDSAVGFNPQPEPPANQWGIEGFIDMTALKTAPTGSTVPFGLDSEIIGDGLVDFSAGIKASFIAPDDDGDLKPDDGTLRGDDRMLRRGHRRYPVESHNDHSGTSISNLIAEWLPACVV